MTTTESNPASTLAPRRLPTQERSRKRFHAMLDAFGALLVEKGFDSLTTHMVAERAGVPVGTLYQFFPNKFSLAAALSRRYEESYAGFITAGEAFKAEPLPPAEEVLDRLTDAVAAMLFADEVVIRLWAITQVVPELAEIREEAGELTLRLCRTVLSPYLKHHSEARLAAICATVGRVVYALLFTACQEGPEARETTLAELRRVLKAYIASCREPEAPSH